MANLRDKRNGFHIDKIREKRKSSSMNDTPTQARYIADKFGGISALARALGHRNVTTVQYWIDRGHIPTHRYAEIIAASERVGADVTREDFVRHLPERPTAAE